MSKLRKKKIVFAGFQIRLIALLTGLAALGMLLEFMIFGARFVSALDEVRTTGGSLADHIPSILLTSLGLTLLIILPLIVILGVQVTHRIAGRFNGSTSTWQRLPVVRMLESAKFAVATTSTFCATRSTTPSRNFAVSR